MRTSTQVRADRIHERAYLHGLAAELRGSDDIVVTVRSTGKVVGHIEPGGVRMEPPFLTTSHRLVLKALATVRAGDEPWDVD